MLPIEKVIIIGSGPAAHTAAIYTGRAGLTPLMFEGEMAGGVPAGGQLTTTTHIENFPGFAESISGLELMLKMREQATNCGTRIQTKTIDKVLLNVQPFQIFTGQEVFLSQSLIIATGATAKRLGIPGEEQFWQKGISACAVCDGGLPLFRNKPLVVVGGGDTALEEALYLTNFASQVILLVRRDALRASHAMQERVLANPKIQIRWQTVPVAALGTNLISHLRIINTVTQAEEEIEAAGLFYAVGHTPNTTFLDQQLTLDDSGYLVTQAGTTQTSCPGVFACGDVQDKKYRQAIVAAGSGCMAALEVERYLG